jgi:hypothetical protein
MSRKYSGHTTAISASETDATSSGDLACPRILVANAMSKKWNK